MSRERKSDIMFSFVHKLKTAICGKVSGKDCCPYPKDNPVFEEGYKIDHVDNF